MRPKEPKVDPSIRYISQISLKIMNALLPILKPERYVYKMIIKSNYSHFKDTFHKCYRY